MMYYRVAFQAEPTATWQWKSTVLSSLGTLFQFLRLYQALPQDQLRVYSSCSRESLEEQLAQDNNGLESHSVSAEQFLDERMIGSQQRAWTTAESGEQGTREKQRATSIAITFSPVLKGSNEGASILAESGMSALEWRRREFEEGVGGDHDSPYVFTLPTSTPQVLKWVQLLARVQEGFLIG